RADHLFPGPTLPTRAILRARCRDDGISGVPVNVRDDAKTIRRRPCERRRRRLNALRQIACGAARYWHNMDVSSSQSFIAHQPFDERHQLSIRRNVRLRNLPLRLIDLAHPTVFCVDAIEARDPPVVVSPLRAPQSPPTPWNPASSHIRKRKYLP